MPPPLPPPPEPAVQGRDRYSRLVATLKVTLPLVALAMLAALFLIQPGEGDGPGLIFAEGDIKALGSGLRISNADFEGTNPAGDRFRFRAAQVVPDAAPPTRATLTDLSGSVAYVGGPTIDLRADSGDLVLATRLLTLTGAVEIETSDGQRLAATEVVLDLAAGRLDAVGLAGGASGAMQVVPAGEADADRRFSVGNGVRLRYDPPAETR